MVEMKISVCAVLEKYVSTEIIQVVNNSDI